MSIIHVASPSGKQSQHEEDQLRSMWEQGLLIEGTKYWKDGMSEWLPLASYFEPAVSRESPTITPPPLVVESSHSQAKDPRKLTSFLVFMLWISLGMEIISILSDLAQMSLLNDTFTEAEAATNDSRQSLIAISYIGVFITTGITFLKWIYRANSNCSKFSQQKMKFTPGWSIGYYFIPILNIFRPYQVMKEIWNVSKNPTNWKKENGSSLVGWWWALWVISCFLGQVIFRNSTNAVTIDELQASTSLSIFASMIGIPLCLVAINMIKRIATMQARMIKNS
jgi:hypothetical protein